MNLITDPEISVINLIATMVASFISGSERSAVSVWRWRWKDRHPTRPPAVGPSASICVEHGRTGPTSSASACSSLAAPHSGLFCSLLMASCNHNISSPRRVIIPRARCCVPRREEKNSRFAPPLGNWIPAHVTLSKVDREI